MSYRRFSFDSKVTTDPCPDHRGLIGLAGWTDDTILAAILGAWHADRPILLINPAATGIKSILTMLSEAGLTASTDHRRWRANPDAPIMRSLPTGFHVILMTSGTCGLPQLVALSRSSIEFNVKALTTHLASSRSEPERVLCHLPMFHAFGLSLGFFQALLKGKDFWFTERFDAKALADELTLSRPSFLPLVPAQAEALIASFATSSRGGGRPAAGLPAAGVSVLGGDFVSASRQEQLMRLLPNMQHTVGYGLTEAGPVLCHTALDAAPLDGGVGKPLPGVRLKRDEASQACWFQSPGQCAALWDPRALSWRAAANTWLPTGDVLVPVEGHGLQFLGRTKAVIKRKGETIFPLAIEQALSQATSHRFPLLLTAALGASDTDPELVLLIEGTKGDAAEDAIAAAILQLPSFYRPSRWVWTPELPRNALGKIQRGELFPDLARPQR